MSPSSTLQGVLGVYLAEGKHYKALSSEESDKVWEARKKTSQTKHRECFLNGRSS